MHSSSLLVILSCHHMARESCGTIDYIDKSYIIYGGTHLQSAQWHEYALPRLLEIYQKPPK